MKRNCVLLYGKKENVYIYIYILGSRDLMLFLSLVIGNEEVVAGFQSLIERDTMVMVSYLHKYFTRLCICCY